MGFLVPANFGFVAVVDLLLSLIALGIKLGCLFEMFLLSYGRTVLL